MAKHYEDADLSQSVKAILETYPDRFNAFGFNDIQVLLKKGKHKAGKKPVKAVILKEPMTLVTPKRAIFTIVDEWWQEADDRERAEGLVEGLLAISRDEEGELAKRDYDVKTYKELVKDPKIDFSKFEKVIPGFVPDLELKHSK
jgi:hypothetical protein